MSDDKFIKTTFLLSLLGHSSILLVPSLAPRLNSNTSLNKNTVIMVTPEMHAPLVFNKCNAEIEEKQEILNQSMVEQPTVEQLDSMENLSFYDENILERIKINGVVFPVLEEMPLSSQDKKDAKIHKKEIENNGVVFSKKKSLNDSQTLVKSISQNIIISYQSIIKQKIEDSKTYPIIAQKYGIEGKVFLNFTILSNGFADDIKIVSSSGFEILDKEAIATVKKANPFPAIPKELNCFNLNIKVAIVFDLS